MKFLDKLFGGKPKCNDWTPTHRGIVYEISYDDIVSLLGKPNKSEGGFVYWRGPLTEIDPDLSEGDFFQISNLDYRIKRELARASIDRNNWFIITNSPRSIKIISGELNGLAKDIEKIADK